MLKRMGITLLGLAVAVSVAACGSEPDEPVGPAVPVSSSQPSEPSTPPSSETEPSDEPSEDQLPKWDGDSLEFAQQSLSLYMAAATNAKLKFDPELTLSRLSPDDLYACDGDVVAGDDTGITPVQWCKDIGKVLVLDGPLAAVGESDEVQANSAVLRAFAWYLLDYNQITGSGEELNNRMACIAGGLNMELVLEELVSTDTTGAMVVPYFDETDAEVDAYTTGISDGVTEC